MRTEADAARTRRSRLVLPLLILLWAVLFLPHLRTNPLWYGDEGDWMEASWALVHGEARHGPMRLDFLFPYPYPPLYLWLNGTALRLFGNDILVGRLLQALNALAAALLLVWVGSRLKSPSFGWLCAVCFLVYPEAVANFRTVRSHPLAGTLALASVGFLIVYVQERRLRHLLLAGLFCSLATATSYWAGGLIAAVVATAAVRNWRHILPAAAVSVAYLVLFCGWYAGSRPDGLVELFKQTERLQFMNAAIAGAAPGFLAEVGRCIHHGVRFLLLTPATTRGGVPLVDLWLVGATAGVIFFPVARFRPWLALWLVALMSLVVHGRHNLSQFTYPATVFIPLLAVGVAGALERLGSFAARILPWRPGWARALPGAVLLALCGAISLRGSLGQVRTKVDAYSNQSAADAEAVARFLNVNTTAGDFVIVPNHLFWLVSHARKAQLIQCAAFDGKMVWPYAAPVPAEFFWFDCDWRNAKYAVIAAGRDARGRPVGIDAVFWLNMGVVSDIVRAMEAEGWTVEWSRGEYRVLANPRRQGTW